MFTPLVGRVEVISHSLLIDYMDTSRLIGNQMLKQLNKNDFIPVLLKDLGMIIEASNNKYRKAVFLCTECEDEYISRVSTAKKQTTTLCPSCSGAKNGKDTAKHHLRNHKLYSKWRGIKKRCHLKTSDGYPMYGAKGVTMCSEWRNDFKVFYEWAITNGYEDGLQIDKDIICIEKNIHPHIYSPETCKWVTLIENLNNRSGYKKCQ